MQDTEDLSHSSHGEREGFYDFTSRIGRDRTDLFRGFANRELNE
jgi:hypothetical protein